MIDSVLSRRWAKFANFDIKKLYLCTPLNLFEYVWIKLSDIPQELIDEYDLLNFVRDGWVYFEIMKGVYGLPQARMLENKLLETRLNEAGTTEPQQHPAYGSTSIGTLHLHSSSTILE